MNHITTENRPFQNMGAIANAVNPTPDTFKNGQSFSDGNLVVGVDERKIVIAWNNTEHNQHMVTILEHQDAVNLFAVLTSALKSKKLLY